MIALLLFLAADFTPRDAQIPNRQPQLAAEGRRVGLTYGAGNTIYYAESRDGGASFGPAGEVARPGVLSLGNRRGPRVAFSGDAIVISAIAGEKGKGVDGDLLAWRSADGGKTWSAGTRINGVVSSAREGMHAMAAAGNVVFAAWLDLRAKGTRLYGSVSADGGVTWGPNRLVYESPSGSVCECCHPSAFVDAQGRIYVMFRNALNGNRDLYVVRSDDRGQTFGAAAKLGSGTWVLNACPMDGGSLSVDAQGQVAAVWRREGNLFFSGIGGEEALLGAGKHPVVAQTPQGPVMAWTEGAQMRVQRAGGKMVALPGEGAFLSLVPLADGTVLLAGERAGTIFVRPVP